jgi:hypothetical protein
VRENPLLAFAPSQGLVLSGVEQAVSVVDKLGVCRKLVYEPNYGDVKRSGG